MSLQPQNKRRLIWLLAFGYFTVHGLLMSAYRILDDRSRGHRGTFPFRLIEEMTAAYAAALIFPVVIKFARHFRPGRTNWAARIPLHLIALVGFSFSHTTLVGLSRKLLFFIAGLGTYNFGSLPLRYATELAIDSVFYWLLVVLVYMFDSYRESHTQELKTAQLEAQLNQAKLDALNLQLQPHFLFNALNTISSVLYEDVDRADQMITRLGEFLRATLESSNDHEVTLRQELRLLSSYLDIMQSRFGDRLTVRLDVPMELHEALVPPLILQPMVENSMKYAADPHSGEILVDVSARRSNGDLFVDIRDAGVGGHDLTHVDGIGLSNTRQRLRQLYGDAQTLKISAAKDKGFCVTFKIPFHTSSNVISANVDSFSDS